jgi:hypothetical protein
LCILNDALQQYRPDFELDENAWQKVFTQMWPGRPFDKAELRNKMAVLLSLLKQFLSWQELQAQPTQQALLTLAQLRRRGLQKPFESEIRKVSKYLDAKTYPTADDSFLRYRLADEANSIYGLRQMREFDASLQAKIDHLDDYYLHVRLRESCELLNRHEVLNTDYQPDFFDSWLEQIGEDDQLLQERPALAIYLQILTCYKKPDEPEVYQKLKKLLLTHGESFFPEEARGMYRHAQNYCIRRINVGKIVYLEELFDLYKEELQSGLILIHEELDHSDYKNIVTVGLRLKQYVWVSEFMEEYRALVQPVYRDNVYHFCQADLLYAKRKLGEAIRLLQTVAFTDVFYQLSSRMLLIKLYFEMKEEEGLFYALDAFERFLRRNKSIARERREGHRNFIAFSRRLARLRERQPLLVPADFQQRLSALRSRMRDTDKISNLRWLEEKFDGLGPS